MHKIVSLLFLVLFVTVVSGQSRIALDSYKNSQKIELTQDGGFILSLHISNINVEQMEYQGVKYHKLLIDGMNDHTQLGSPSLPVLKKLIELPATASYEIKIRSIKTETLSLSKYGLHHALWPEQASVVKIKDAELEFTKEESLYQTNAFFGFETVTIERLGRQRALDLARLEVSPIRYNPVTGKLEVIRDLVVEIVVKNVDYQQLSYDNARWYTPQNQSINNLVVNHKSLEAKAKSAPQTHFPMRYVIVADSMFKQSLQPFVRWKEKQGYQVIEAYTQNPAVGSSNTSIKNYLAGLYNNASLTLPAPSYALLVGDVAQMPVFSGVAPGGHITDLYYFEYTNDNFPEMYYGRFSATDTAQLNAQIEKTLMYEKYVMPNPSYLAKSILISGDDASYSPTFGDGQINYGSNNYFTSANATQVSSYLYATGSYNKDSEIRQKIDSGVSIANYTGHGSITAWANPEFSNSHVNSMTNYGKYGFLIGNACITNTFNNNVCFGEALLRAKNKGAIGYIGASNNTYWDEDYFWSVGVGPISSTPTYASTGNGAYDLMFHNHNESPSQWAMSAGQYLTAGNLAVTQGGSRVLYYWEVYHLMGDPSLMPYQRIPLPLNITYNPLIPQNFQNFNVFAEPNALVAISKNDSLIASAVADTNGMAQLLLPLNMAVGSYDLMVTAQNRQPFYGSLQIATSNSPYVMSTNPQLANVADSSISQPFYQSEYFVDIDLINLASVIAVQLEAQLLENDPYITLLDSIHSVGNIAPHDTLRVDSIFKFKIHSNCPNNHVFNGIIKLTDSVGNVWNNNFNFTVGSPEILIQSCRFDDAIFGNSNRKIDAGEKIRFYVLLNNSGQLNSESINCSFTTLSTWATSAPAVMVDSLVKQNWAEVSFDVTFDAQLTEGQYVNFLFSYQSGDYNGQKYLPQMIGNLIEDFETADFNKFSWNNIQTYPWQIDTLTQFDGSYSSRSFMNLPNNKASEFWIEMNVLNDDSISFYHKVSTENNYDYFYFYVDNVIRGTWSGISDWTKAQYPVAVGQRTFKWLYTKDTGFTVGSDAVWIDQIDFPATDLWSVICPTDPLRLSSFELFPNPTTSEVVVNFELPQSAQVSANLYHIDGRFIQNLHGNQRFSEGKNAIKISLENQAAGVYFIELRAGAQRYFQRVVKL